MKKNKNVPMLRFPEFTVEWEEKKLGEIAELTSSKRVYLSDYVSYGIPFYRGKEISELKENLKPKDLLYISEKTYNDFKVIYGVPSINDLLITAVGTLGNVYRIKDNQPFYFKDGNLIWLRNINQNSSFLEILLHVYHSEIEKSAIGSSQKALTMIELRKLLFLFPLLPEQTKIASFLTAVDEKLTQLKKKKTLLEQYKKGIMQKLFSQELRFKDNNNQDFPDWQEKTLGEIAEIIGGGTPDTYDSILWNGRIEWFTPTELKTKYVSSSVRKISLEGLKKSSAKILPVGTVLFSSRATVGDVSIALKECTTNQGFQSFVVKVENCNEFIYYWISHNKDEFIKRASGSTFLEISKNEISKMKITLPFLLEQQKIATFLSSIDDKISHCSAQIEKMEAWKKGLLQQMFC